MPFSNVIDTERIARKTVTFTAAGDGAVGTVTLFTVTGTVRVRVLGVCTTSTTIQAGATIKVGISTSLAVFIAQTAADATVAGEIWHDNSPDAEIELDTVASWYYVADGNDIILTVATDTVDSGVIEFYCEYQTISGDGDVVAA